MSSKSSRIEELQRENDGLEQMYTDLVRDYNRKCNEVYELRSAPAPEAKKREYAGDVSFDYWPLSDWVRFSYTRWNPGQYLQVCVGPIRVEFFAL